MTLKDFQIHLAGVPSANMRANHRLFPFYEAVRLWTRAQKLEAPFGKIVVMLVDELQRAFDGRVISVMGVCTVWIHTPDPSHDDPNAVWNHVDAALGHIARENGWRSPALEQHIQRLRHNAPVCSHRFEKLQRKHKGTTCNVWFEAEPGRSTVKVVFERANGAPSDHVLIEKPGPLYLEDAFPAASAVVIDSHYVIRDRHKQDLTRISIP